MGEHRRRAHQQMPMEDAEAVQSGAEESVYSHAVHRRRQPAEQSLPDEPVQEAMQAPEEHREDEVHQHHAHRRRQQAQETLTEPIPLQMDEVPQTDEVPQQPIQPTAQPEKEPEKAPERRMVSGHKKTAKKLKKSPKKKKKGGMFRGIHECLLGAAVLLGAVGKAALACLKKAGEYVEKTIRRLRKLPLRAIAMAFLLCVALVSAWQIGSIAVRSLRTRHLNDELSRKRAQLAEEAQSQLEEEWVVYEGETIPMKEALAMLENMSTPMPQQMPVLDLTPVPVDENTQPQRENRVNATTTTKYRHLGGDALPEMAALRQQNSDLVAWMQIPDVLDLPVVYRDNDYYLTHDFNKKNSKSGTVFLDENHPFKEKTQNLLLHGHNMKDGTMFGRLAQYLYDDSYLRNHPFVYFDTLWRKEQYVIFAVLNVSLKPTDSRFFNYFTHDTFTSDAEFTTYIRQLQLRSEYAIPIDVQPDDALLTLSTCLDEDRLVIVARRLREGETRSQLRTLIRMSTRQ